MLTSFCEGARSLLRNSQCFSLIKVDVCNLFPVLIKNTMILEKLGGNTVTMLNLFLVLIFVYFLLSAVLPPVSITLQSPQT